MISILIPTLTLTLTLTLSLTKADEEGIPCYLENSNPINTSIYEHFGFVRRDQIDLTTGMGGPEAPALVSMWREVPLLETPPNRSGDDEGDYDRVE